MGLSKTEILAAASEAEKRLRTEEVKTPEWGADATVRIRELTAAERWLWQNSTRKSADDDKLPDPSSVLICMAAVDDSGAKLFQASDADWLRKQPSSLINRVADRVLELSDASNDATADVAAAGNDSGKTTSESLPSDSPNDSE